MTKLLARAAPSRAVGRSQILSAAARIGSMPELSLERRRARLLRALAPHLGPAQLEHVTLHCEHAASAARRLAQLMRVPPQEVEGIRLGALLHDLGKAIVPERLLSRAGPLNPEERTIVSRHAADSAHIARLLGASPRIVEDVRRHHDRFDGADAPDGSAPPLGARVIRVADAMVVMTAGRPYSAARTYTEAFAELRRGRGTVFDPDAVVAAHVLGASVMALAA
jgi:putative nucleotidyltransferase with HDIG domain